MHRCCAEAILRDFKVLLGIVGLLFCRATAAFGVVGEVAKPPSSVTEAVGEAVAAAASVTFSESSPSFLPKFASVDFGEGDDDPRLLPLQMKMKKRLHHHVACGETS